MNVNYNSLSTGRDILLKNGIGDSVGSPPISNSKAMKKSWLVTLLLFLSMTIGQLTHAQSTANYAFATNATGSLALDANGNTVDMSTGATALVATAIDQGASAVTNIGFSFPLMGNVYTQFSASSNGTMALGGTAIGTAVYTAAGGTTATPLIAAWGSDGITTTNGVRSKVVGTAPNRCLVVEFNMALYWLGSAPASQMQVRLYETTGVIQYVYGAMAMGTSTNPGAIGFAVGAAANTLASITNATNTVSTTAWAANPTTASSPVVNLNSAADGSRRVYSFTPNATPIAGDAATLTFSAVTLSTITPTWVDNSTNESFFVVTRALDAGFTTGVVVANVASTTSAGTGTSYSLAQTGLSPGTTYFYKIQAGSEVVFSTGITGSQATTAGVTYYWVGASASPWTTAGNWNTIAVGGGSTRSTPLTTDILIVDGAGIVAGGALIIPVGASATIGQLRVTSGTALTLQSDAVTQRVLTISGGGGDDFTITAGSTLSLSNLSNPISIVFTGGGNTGLIDGTLNVSGSSITASAANSFVTTGGTGTVVTVSSTGIINNNATTNITTNGNVTGSAATLVFASGSAYNATGATSGAVAVPLATWATTSTVTITGVTTSTGLQANNNQSFGNFVYNCPLATGTMSVFTTTTTAVIKGDLTVTAGATGGAGIFRAVTTGTLNVTGNVNVLQGRFQSASSTGTLIVSGNTTISANGIVDILAGTYSQRGTTFTNNGTLTGVASTVRLQFLSVAAQTFAGSGTVLTNIGGLSVQNGGLNITHANQIPTLRVNLFLGTITGSAKLTMGTGAALTATTQIGAAGVVTPAGNFDAIPTFNLGTGAYNVIYAQESVARTTGFEIPSSRLISSLELSNSNGLVISGGGLGTGTLTFSALSGGNITTTAANLLTVTGTATTNVVRTLATAYVNGPLALTLPASLAATTYTFPIGKGSLNTFALVGATTNAGGTVTVKAEAFDGDAGGTAGINISTMSTTRYWAASITAGGANFTSSLIQLNDVSTGRDAIAASATQTGAYDIQGGVAITTTATSLTTTAPANTTLPGFFLMANKAAANITNVVVAPVGNQCTNVARTITADVTPGGGAVTSVVINYTVNGVAGPGSPLTMTATTANGFPLLDSYTGTIPTVTPANAVVAWSITATDANALTKTVAGTGYTDAPNTGIAATASATVSNICAVGTSVLNVAVTTTAIPAAPAATAYCASTHSSGCSGDNIARVVLNTLDRTTGTVCGSPAASAYSNLTGLTGANTTTLNAGTAYTLSLTFGTDSTQFFGAWIDYNHDGVYSSTEFLGASANAGASGTTGVTFTPSALVALNGLTHIRIVGGNDSAVTSGQACGASSSSFGETQDYDVTIAGGLSTLATPIPYTGTITSITWNDGTSNVGTGNALTVTPTLATTNYTASVVIAGCPVVSSAATVNIVPIPTAPTQTGFDATCGVGVPLVAVTDPNGFTTPIIKWYAADGTTLLQSNVATTYLASISTTTTFQVSVVNPTTGCESTKTTVIASVATPDSIDAIANQTVCVGNGFNLTATSVGAYTYTWTATGGAASGITGSLTGAAQTITPTTVGSYTYTVSGTDGVCSAQTTFTATVNAFPALSGASASPAAVCTNGISTLTASVPGALIFTATTGASLDPMTGAATLLTTSNDDTVTAAPVNIGFSFTFNGIAYTQYNASPDGWISLGAGPASNSFGNNMALASNLPKLAPMWDDLATGTTGNVTAVTTGTAPNRILKVQWFVTSPRLTTGAANSTFQAWLYEGSNKIEYRYGTIGNPGSASGGYTIGATNFSSITFSSNTASTVTADNANVAAPVSGTMYAYTLPVPGNVTWAPLNDLYTNAGATIPYTGTNAAVVYSKPTVTRVYNAYLSANGCTTTSSNVTVTQNGEFVADPTGPTTICLGSPTIPAGPITYTNGQVTTSYFSSNPAVATIDQATGVLTPLTAGTTNITAQNINLTTGCTSSATNALAVTVSAPIAITLNPVSQTVLEYDGITPTTTTFTAAASGSVLSYRWKVSPTGVSGSYVAIANGDPLYTGQATATLSIANATAAVYNGLFYLCEITPVGPCTPALETTGASLTVSSLTTSDPTFGAPICGTGSYTFTTVSTPPTGVTYQWYYATLADLSDAVEITGAFGGLTFPLGVVGASLEVNGLSATENLYYFFVVASDGTSFTQTNAAQVIVNTAQTVVTTGPSAVQDATVCFNSVNSRTFTVSSSGGSGFQWQYSATNNGIDWVNVANATPAGATYLTPTGATLTVNSTAVLAVGTYYYRCLVAGPSGCPAIASNVATLTVTTPTITASASVPTICGSGSSVLTASGAGVSGSYAWTAAPTLAAPLNLDTVTATPTTTTTYTVTGTTAAGCISTGTVTVTFGIVPTASIVASATTVCSGELTTLSIPTGSGGVAPTYCIPTSAGSSNVATVNFNTLSNSVTQLTPFVESYPASGATTTTVVPGSTYPLAVTATGTSIASVWIDYDRNGTYETTEHTQLWTSASSGTVNITIPSNASQGPTGMRVRTRLNGNVNGPGDACLNMGSGSTQDYTISIGYDTTGYTYSWSSTPAGLSATTASVSVNPTVSTTYSVLITTPLGCTATPSQLITIASGIAIVGQPQNATFCEGTTASLSVGATGSGLNYQWRKGGVDLFGEISSSITFLGATAATSGSYDVVITDACGGAPVTSNVAVLTIVPTPTVNAVTAQTICAGLATPVIALTGNTTTFNISGGAAIGLADATAVSAVPSFTAIAGTATISVTPVVVSGATTCTGTATTFTYLVNASPASPVASSNSPVCADGTINLAASTVSIPGYSMNPSSGVAFVDISVSGTAVPSVPNTLADDSEHAITIPSFTYNGVAYTTALVGNNGALAFGLSTGSIGFGNTALPTLTSNIGGGTGAGLFPLWDDLTPGAGGSIKTQTIGNITYIQWTNEDNFGATGTGTVTFQVQLNSTTGQVTFAYPDVVYGVAGFDGGQTATVGIQYNASTALQYSFNTASLVNGQSITFTPNVASYAWTGPNAFTSSLQNPTRSALGNAGTYSVTATNTATGCSSAAATTTVVVDTPTTWYADADGDTRGNLAVSQLACTQPSGYVANSTDCDDTNINIYQFATFNVDSDGDGYTNGTASVCSGVGAPAGYSTGSLGTDCDDNNNLVYQSNTLYTDADGDTYTVGTGAVTCYGATVPAGLTLTQNGTDCDDTNVAIYQVATFYVDSDNDGYDNGSASVCSGAGAPTGYSATTSGTDCNDSNAAIYQLATFFVDADADGYDNGSASVCSGVGAPTGYSATTSGTDCDDTNAAKTVTYGYYTDADFDTYGAIASGVTQLCTVGNVAPSGYSVNNLDCDDTSASLNPTNPCATGKVVNLTLAIEGYYDSGVSAMRSVKLNQDLVSPATDVEDLTVELHDAGTIALVDTAVGTLHTDGTLSVTFNTAAAGSYYLTVKGTNMIQTWTANPVAVGNTPLSYDFTSSAAQAFGANMVEVVTGVFAFYTGDIDQNGNIDPLDYNLWEFDYNNFASGVFATDLDGNGNVDPLDYNIWEVNYNNFISTVSP